MQKRLSQVVILICRNVFVNFKILKFKIFLNKKVIRGDGQLRRMLQTHSGLWNGHESQK